MARWPTVISAAVALAPPLRRFAAALAQDPMGITRGSGLAALDIVVAVLVLIIMLLMLVWMVALMYQSFRICCNLKGAKAIVTFVVALLIAEALSKVVILNLLARGGVVR
jgi:hypothetical protein